LTSRSEPADIDMRDIAPRASTMGVSCATLFSMPPAENAIRGVSGVGGGRSRSTFSSRFVATSVSRRMRENSMRVAAAWSPISNATPTALHNSQNIEVVNRAPKTTAIGILNACMWVASCVLDLGGIGRDRHDLNTGQANLVHDLGHHPGVGLLVRDDHDGIVRPLDV